MIEDECFEICAIRWMINDRVLRNPCKLMNGKGLSASRLYIDR